MEQLGRGYAWFDAGTYDSLIEAAVFIQAIEKRQGQRIGVPEEISFQKGWIGREKMLKNGRELRNSGYGEYLLSLAQEDV